MFNFFKRRLRTDFEKKISSPDGKLILNVVLKSGHLSYSLSKSGKTVLKNSILGFKLKSQKPLDEHFGIVRGAEKSFSETWETVWGEERYIENNYNEFAIYLSETTGDRRLLTVRFRIFNDGIGFRYEIPPQPSFYRIEVEDELTEFNIDLNSLAWQIPAYQSDRYEYNYEKTPVYELTKSVHTPTTFELKNGLFVAIHEAALYNYGEMTLKLNQWKTLQSDITPLSDGIKARLELPFDTPWRVVMVGDSALDLVKNRIVLNLNDPPKEDFSWVKPLKFLGIWWAMYVGEWTWASGEKHGATTEHAFEYINYCKKLGIEGLLLEGWNGGWDGDWLKNGATTNFLSSSPDCDLKQISNYASENGVKLVGHHETVGFVDNYESQLENAYQFYANLGINYIKPGYAGSMMTIQGKREYHHSQIGVLHYQRALELAAKYHICLDVHEPIKGTGIERTFPNLLSREGARGQEYEGGAISPSHACILPFTRLLAGGMDYTPGIFDLGNSVKRISSTLARQLAYFVTIPSGMVMASDRPKYYDEIFPNVFKFIHDVPVNWEATVPLFGKIGEYYVVARKDRTNGDWFIGGVTNETAHAVRIDFSFLLEGNYRAEIYRDDETAHYRDNPLAIKIETKEIKYADTLDVYMAPGGGFAIHLTKIP